MSKDVEIKGLKELNKKLAGMDQRADNLYPPLNAIGYIIARSVRKNIHAQGRPPWNKPSGRVKATGGKTLIKHTHLYKSIKHRVIGNVVIVGTKKIQAAILHFGGIIKAKNVPYLCFRIPWETGKSGKPKFVKVKSVKIPPRPYMMIQKIDIKKSVKIFDDYIVRART